MEAVVTAADVGIRIGKREIFSGVSMCAAAGSLVCLVGPSGSGKTTLLNCLSVLQRPSAGVVSLKGEPTTKWSNRQRERFWRRDAAFIYQDYGLIDDESLAYNVTLRMGNPFGRTPYDLARVEEVLAEAGLQGRAREAVSVLSGGERQRAGVARALYKNATIVFADEPTASLDADNRATVTALLLDLVARGSCVIVATHDETLARQAGIVVELV